MARGTQDGTTTTEETPKVKPPTAREAYDALPAVEDGAGQFVQGAIENAVALLEAKEQIQADLQQSRDFLAFAGKSGQVNTEQGAWIAAYLPKRTKGAATGAGEES